tara:strand:- start:13776 stop:14945 length:1170 start_codon:yes stop_codon:yes gene_type:complete
VERWFPKIGKVALLISVSQFLGILLNGILGWFPAGLIGTGGRGEKFHLLQYLRKTLNLPYKSNGFWSDAGTLTGQEYAMLAVMVISLVIAVIGLRPRPLISGPEKRSIEEQQAQLESGQVSVSRPGGLSVVNPTTAAIVSSIVGNEDAPPSEIIASALGEMTAVAVEMGVDDFLIKGEIIQESVDDTTIDSRFTTKVGDYEDDIIDLTGTIDENSNDEDEDLGWLDDSEIDIDDSSKSVFDPTPSIVEPVLPKIPKTTTTKNVEPIAPPKVKAVTPPVVNATPPPVEKVVTNENSMRQKDAQYGSMPRRPSGLPKAAEFDIELNTWTLFGRPVEVSETPPPVITKPSQMVSKKPVVQTKTPNTPSLPSIPSPPKKTKKSAPRLPNIPQI